MRREDPYRLVLCQSDPVADAYLSRALNVCLDTLQSSNLFKDASVILTGSLARGEGSVLSSGNDLHSLSDMEFLVTPGCIQSRAVLVRELAHLEEVANQAISAAGINCKAEFTYALRRYYINARPSIFAYELKTHGKLVQGYENLLSLMPSFPAEDIPRIDAFYLLCNRMVEQLELFRAFFLSKDSCSNQEFRYAILKGYVDIATSVLVFNRQFVPSYQGRRDLFCKSRLPFDNGTIAIERLKERVDFWTDVKLNPSADSLSYRPEESALQEWRELAILVSQIWQWELEQLIGGTDDQPEHLQKQFMGLGTFSQIMRNRLKFLITALRRNELTISKTPFLIGNPRHVLYAEVGNLYCRIAQESGPVNQNIPPKLSEKIENIVHIWDVYFRNS